MNLQPSLSVGTVILDEVLDAIAGALTSRTPERGGLLFGPRGQKLITLFEADEMAEHHFGTYTPSAGICQRCLEIERDHGLEYKGIIHSHPGAMDHPSMQDIENARNALVTNPHLSYFMMPIVTLGAFRPLELDSNELLLPSGKLSHWMVPQAVSVQGRQLFRERITSLALWGDLKALAVSLPGRPKVDRSTMLDIEGVSAAAYLLDAEDGTWMFAAAAGYPFTPPLVVPPAGGHTSVPLAWDLGVSADRRLHAAVVPLLGSRGIPLLDLPACGGIEKMPAPVQAGVTRTRMLVPWSRAALFVIAVCLSGLVGRHYPVSKCAFARSPQPHIIPNAEAADNMNDGNGPMLEAATHPQELEILESVKTAPEAGTDDFMRYTNRQTLAAGTQQARPLSTPPFPVRIPDYHRSFVAPGTDVSIDTTPAPVNDSPPDAKAREDAEPPTASPGSQGAWEAKPGPAVEAPDR